MVSRTLIRGDDYLARRSVFSFGLIDVEQSNVQQSQVLLNMAGHTIRSTFREGPVAPGADPTDAGAALRAEIAFDANGDVIGTPLHLALPAGMTAADGRLELRLGKTITAGLPLGTVLRFDIQVTTPDGEDDTVMLLETLSTEDGYTSRSGVGLGG